MTDMGATIMQDGATPQNDANLNKFISAGGTKTTVQLAYARIRYTGSAWEVVATTDSALLTSSDLAWDGTNFEVDIDLTGLGFTNPPVVLPASVAADTNLNVKAHASAADTAHVRFYAIDGGAPVDTEATTMDVNLLLIGE